MNLSRIISEEILKFLKENYDSEQGSILDTYFDNKYPYGTGESKTDLSGEYVGDIYPNNSNERPCRCYKNPQNLDGFDPNCRGILLENLDFYVVDFKNVTHTAIIRFLEILGVIGKGYVNTYDDYFPKQFICVHRQDNSNIFGISTAYNIDRFPKYYVETFNNANRKGRIKFEVKYHGYK